MGTRRNNGSSDTVSQLETAESTVDLTAPEEPLLTVVRTVAELMGTSANELPPLADTIDPDALNSVFPSRDPRTMNGEIRFEYYDCTVSITSDGVVSVQR